MQTTIFPGLVHSSVRVLEFQEPRGDRDAAELVLTNAELAWSRFEAALSDGLDGKTVRTFLDRLTAMLADLEAGVRSMTDAASDDKRQKDEAALVKVLNRSEKLMEKAAAVRATVGDGLPGGFWERAQAAIARNTGVSIGSEEIMAELTGE